MSDAAVEPLDRGTYELLRERVRGHGRELATRVEAVNAARKKTFGGVEPELLATERISTEHSCIPRDIAAIGDVLLFGFNVQFGLKATRAPSDVFAAYTFSENRFHPRTLDLLADPAFEKDFQDVYRYYKSAAFEKFVRRGPLFYMQLRTGAGDADIKTFKWSVEGSGLRYLDNRSEHEIRQPPQYDFEWQRTRRENHVHGKHPHVNIADRVFVETIGGDLTIKVENNTESGEGLYSEPVENADQTLDDADIRYALLDSLVLLRITPYQESAARYFVFFEKTRQVVRLDRIGDCCRLLPAEQGLLHPAGYLLQTGDGKTFDGVPAGASFEQRIDSPNGEDFLYVFYHRTEGLYVLIRYNLIAQAADAPLLCHGFTLFPDGELVCFRAQPDPQRHHATQIWRTPFSIEALLPQAESNAELAKIGNREIVAGLSECRELLALLDKEDAFGNVYADLAKRAGDLLDSYHWIRSAATLRLDEPLEQIRAAASAAIDEYEKVARSRESAGRQVEDLAKRVSESIAAAGRQRFESVGEFTTALGELRALRGAAVGLRDVRYVDAERIGALEQSLQSESEKIAARCVAFLDRPDALNAFHDALAQERQRLGTIRTAQEAKAADESVARIAGDLETLIETIANLPLEDATQRTRVVDAISSVFATVNALRAEIRNRRKDLARTEGAAEFGSQLKLLGQAVVNALDRCETPDQCDEQLTRLLLQIEELEGRFAEFDEFAVTLAEKREEVAAAIESRKAALLEARAKRSDALVAAADRLLSGIASRAKSLDSLDAVHGYFATDLTVAKLRDLSAQLASLGDGVRSDGLLGRLKSLRDESVRQLKDRQELYADGKGVITLGGYRFSVNTQPISLTTIVRDDRLNLHLTGTRFYEPLSDPELLASRDCWDLQFVSESPTVYRGEYLADALFQEVRDQPLRADLLKMEPAERTAWVAERMAPRYAEGYLKGVHDNDAALILHVLLSIDQSLGPLRTPPAARALARLYWLHACHGPKRNRLSRQRTALRELAAVWPDRVNLKSFLAELRETLTAFVEERGLFTQGDATAAAAFLAGLLIRGDVFPVSREASDLAEAFHNDLQHRNVAAGLTRSLDAVGADAADRFETARRWLSAFTAESASAVIDEASVLLLPSADDRSDDLPTVAIDAAPTTEIDGLLGEHPLIAGGRYRFDYYRFVASLESHHRDVAPRYRQFVERKHAAVEQAREELRLDELKPQVMGAFIRNRLIDSVYLPLIGANLAKQIGVAGEETRVDRQGLLLVISPPGYGKTTLMEYVADRLGLMFLKINGPAIGHAITSLDPESATNLAAREELKKLGFGLEAGDNLMLYVDDIQHCHPEFLQKFISLCDAQRKIEGVWRGEAKTYDLRGRKIAVVMAGNPYTESGETFQIPDMLANRADVHNLGDITGRHREAFELSFLENALSSNPHFARLADRPQDAAGVVALAQGKDPSSVTLEGAYDPGELAGSVSVMRKLLRVREVVLSVNAEYIRSAAQADEFRTAPPFKLQGSYRNMNRIAERVLPAMNDAELDELIWSSYRNDAQTLTTGAEANLLRFRELVGWLTPEESNRWNEIRATFRKNQSLRGVDQSDQFGQAIAQLALFSEGLNDLRDTLSGGIDRLAEQPAPPGNVPVGEVWSELRQTLEQFRTSMLESLSRLAERTDDQPGDRQLTLDPAILRELASSLRSNGPVVQSAAGDDEGLSVPGTVTIVNKIPVTLLNVLQEQFRLMEAWMRPVLTASQRQSDDFDALATQIRTCLDEYRHLVGRIEASREDGRP